MKRRRKQLPEFEAPDLAALAERAVRLDNGEIHSALETTVSTLDRYVYEYRRANDPDFLSEMLLSAQAVYVMAHELLVRRGEAPSTAPARQVKRF